MADHEAMAPGAPDSGKTRPTHGVPSIEEKAAEWEKLLRSRGSRLTLPRKAILGLMLRHPGHLCAKEIYQLIHADFPDIGLTTVYRTLELLVSLRLLNRYDFGDGQSVYERCCGPEEHHHHIICGACGQITDYNDFIEEELSFFRMIQEYLSQRYDFQIEGHELQFFGKCRRCRDGRESSAV